MTSGLRPRARQLQAFTHAMDYGASQFAGGGFVPRWVSLLQNAADQTRLTRDSIVHSPIGDNAYGNNGATQKVSPCAVHGNSKVCVDTWPLIDCEWLVQGSKPVAQTMRNVTIHQILKEVSGDDQYRVDGVDLSTFYIVGRIVDRSENSTALKLKVDDGTGSIEVIHYVEDTNPLIQVAAQEWTVNSYVRVCGHMRGMDGKQSIVAFRIKVVTDFNEITYHNLQCIFQHLHLTKGAAPPASGPPMMMQGQAAHHIQAAQQPSGNKLHYDVLAIYNEAVHNESGLSMSYVLDTLRSRGMPYTLAQVQTTVDFLTNEGQLYSTTDDQHHRSTSI
jgi:replication factor A2